jgi:hypothetical protein
MVSPITDALPVVVIMRAQMAKAGVNVIAEQGTARGGAVTSSWRGCQAHGQHAITLQAVIVR